MTKLFILLSLIHLPAYCFGSQETPNEASSGGFDAIERSDFIPKEPSIDSSEKSTKAYEDSLIAYYKYKERGYSHRSDVYKWQHFSTKIIFFTVITIVLSGLYFSYMQFRSGLKADRIKNENIPQDKDDSRTEIKASLKGIEVSSSVIGIIILTLSIVFFYLYLIHVYPVKDAL